MKIISWNCRGLGSPRTTPSLKYLVCVYKPDMLYLCETISTSNKTEELKYVLGFDFCFTVNKQGQSGGFILYWNSSVNCSISNYSNNHIDAEIRDINKGKWRLTGYYGFPNNGRRQEAWNFLRQLANVSNLPWCIIGDFNDILSLDEKKGNNERANWLIIGFRNAVCDSRLADVHTKGYLYTWFKSLGTTTAVEEHLDRALATESWQIQYPDAVLENLPAPSSDHDAIMLSCELISNNRRVLPQFKFENAWLADPNFRSFVTDKWSS